MPSRPVKPSAPRHEGMCSCRRGARARDRRANWPERFAGLVTLPMQDVPAAIAELEHVMVQHGFKGAMILFHQSG